MGIIGVVEKKFRLGIFGLFGTGVMGFGYRLYPSQELPPLFSSKFCGTSESIELPYCCPTWRK